MQLPVIQDIPKCRAWAAHVGTKGKYQAPAPPHWTRRLDSVFLHPVGGPLVFVIVVVAVFQSIFFWAKPVMDLVQGVITLGRSMGGLADSQPYPALAGGRRRL